MTGKILTCAAALSLAVALCGCSRSPQVNFYTLEPMVSQPATAASQAAPSVAVGPVTLPETVDRSQLVLRVDANRVEVLEMQRWAEPLKTGLPRLIAQDLARLLSSDRVASYQQSSGAGAEYRVLVDFVSFEAGPGETVTVEALWTVRHGAAVRTGRSLVREQARGGGYDAVVAAYSRAVASLSGDLAKAIREEQSAAH